MQKIPPRRTSNGKGSEKKGVRRGNQGGRKGNTGF